jgi:hypothetical protein
LTDKFGGRRIVGRRASRNVSEVTFHRWKKMLAEPLLQNRPLEAACEKKL